MFGGGLSSASSKTQHRETCVISDMHISAWLDGGDWRCDGVMDDAIETHLAGHREGSGMLGNTIRNLNVLREL